MRSTAYGICNQFYANSIHFGAPTSEGHLSWTPHPLFLNRAFFPSTHLAIFPWYRSELACSVYNKPKITLRTTYNRLVFKIMWVYEVEMVSSDGQTIPPLVVDFSQTRVTTYMGFVSFTILMWEHFVTFSDEVNYIWKPSKGPVVWLFFLNRYLTPLGFIINLFAYLSPSWTQERCEHFVRYEGSMTIIGLNTTALMMLLRVYAMYPGNWPVISGVALVFCVELGVNTWLMTHGTAVLHNESIHACTMIFDPSLGPIASASAWLPLLYDTIVVGLTLFRTVGPVRHQAAGKIMRVLLRDGILYYSVIFSINFVLTLMISVAPAGLKNITAQMELLLTVAMMSRITLHLKKQGRLNDTFHRDTWATFSRAASAPPPSALRFANQAVERRRVEPPQVSIMVQELVTRDDSNTFRHGTLNQAGNGTHSSLPTNETKVGEWHEMSVLRKV